MMILMLGAVDVVLESVDGLRKCVITCLIGLSIGSRQSGGISVSPTEQFQVGGRWKHHGETCHCRTERRKHIALHQIQENHLKSNEPLKNTLIDWLLKEIMVSIFCNPQ